jgi:NADH-quinone oxidoreductase subunit M
MILLLILIVPLFAIILINFFVKESRYIKYIPLIASFGSLILIIYYCKVNHLLDTSTYFELIKLYEIFPKLGISMSFSISKVSIVLLVLSNITITTALFSTFKIKKRLSQINTLIMIISIGIYGLIIADDLFVFFLFYEIAVVPMFLIITNWGYDLKREVSGPFERVLRSLSVGTKSYGAYKITLYLLVGSLLIFLGLGVLGINEGTFSINEIISRGSLKTNTNLAFFLLAIGFGSHSALWPLHTWAPDGHGTAPTAGSIIFAGILMKIGIIGFIKIIITIFNPTFIEFSNILIILASINIIYGAFTAMMQDDLKYLAAYASLSHIGYIFLALAMNNQIGLNSALLQTASHGIIICLLFFSVGLIFNAKGTRSIKELNSLHDNAPIISSIFIFSAFASIGFPLTSGFIAEFLIINSIALSNNAILIIIPLIGIFITTLYMFRTVKKICLQYVETNNSYSTISIDEKLICYILIVLIVGIGIFPNFFLNFINGESIKILVGI